MKNNKIISLLLAVVLLMGLLPGTAFAADGDFNHIQFFEESYRGEKSIVSIKIALTGKVDNMPLSDIKDFKMTLDGQPVDVELVDTADTLDKRTEWWNDSESGTSFLFDFSERLTEPGMYRLSFTYKGQTCTGMYPIEDAENAMKEAQENALLIGSEAELRAFAEAVNNGEYDDIRNAYIKLTQDIALTGEWTPIGKEFESVEGWTAPNDFDGTFDGGGHKITGIKIGSKESPSRLKYIGLFAFAPKNVFDLTLEVEFYAAEEDSDSSSQTIGGLAATNGEIFRNCKVSGTIELYGYVGSTVGGLLGVAGTNSFVSDCSSSVTIRSQGAAAGGLIGSADGSVIGCYATGDVSGSTAGGLIGNSGGYIERCYATGNVMAQEALMTTSDGGQIVVPGAGGGFCGYFGGNSEDDMVRNCFALGAVTGLTTDLEGDEGSRVGGFAGSISASYGSVENCYATGDVLGHMAAGFAADVMSSSPDGGWGDGTLAISHCFASGNVVSETGYAAGFVSSSIGARLYDCASLGDVTAKSDAKGFASDFGYGAVERCWSVGDVTSQEGYANIFGYGKNCYAIGNAAGKDAQGQVGESSYFAGTLTAAPNEDGTPKTFQLGETSYGDIALFPIGYDESVTTGKTTAEMQSTAFIDLLNAEQPDKPWIYKEGGYPVLAGFNQESIDAMLSAGAELEAELKQEKINNEIPNQPDNSGDPQSPDNTPSGDNTPNGGEGSDTKPINPAIYIGGGVVLLGLVAAVVLFIIRQKNKSKKTS